jgi:DNA-binding SARP family transcriptional activator/predicted ATPase
MVLSVGILGPLDVRNGSHVIAIGGRRKRALLAALVLNANRTVSLGRLIESIWGERPPATAAATVHVYVSQLRKQLGTARVVTQPSGYQLVLSAEELDHARFQRLVRQARHASDPGERAALLREGLALWRGAALADVAYEPFVLPEAERLEEERLAALEERTDAELELGVPLGLVAELEQLVAAHPLRERFRAQLMLALYRSDRQADALALYRDTRKRLVEDLGLEPSGALRQLEQRILTHDASLMPRAASSLQPPATPGTAVSRTERKIASVLCADVSALGAPDRDPEDVRTLLRMFHGPMSAELTRFGATISQVVGTALIAIFGAPQSHEDDAERAVRAGLALTMLTAGLATKAGLDPGLRIGIATGAVLVTPDADGAPTGELVSSALRLAARSTGQVIVGQGTHRATSDAIQYAGGDDSAGWEAIGSRVAMGERWRRQQLSTFVGRRRELSLLRETLTAARIEREPRIVTLLGPPGIGKTRLLTELRAAETDVHWLFGRSISYGDGLPFYALRQAVAKSLGLLETDTADVAEGKLQQTLSQLAGDAGWVTPGLRLLLGLESPTAGDRRETFAAWRRFLEAQAAREPTVLLLEDVHWADEGLLDFIEYLREWASGPLVVLAAARPELLERRPGWSTLALDPLSDEEARRLLDSLLPDDATPSTRESLVHLAAGIPLYAEEYARSLTLLPASSVAPTPPLSVLAVIAARVDALPLAEKTVLQDAAVVGKVIWPGALAAIGGTDREAVELHLDALEQKQFLRRETESAFAGEPAFTFAHILVRDVAYEQLTRVLRAERHRRTAEWLQAVAEREDRADLVAYHYTKALELARASGDEQEELSGRVAVALLRAGQRAHRLYANDDAEVYFRRGIELARAERQRPVVAELDEGLGDVLALAARHDEAVAAYGAAREHVDRDRIAQARLHRKAGLSRQLQRRVDEALAHFAAGEAALGDQPARGVRRWWHERAEIALARHQLLYFGAPLDEFVARVELDREFIDAHGDVEQRGWLFSWLAMADLRRHRFVPTAAALEYQRAAVEQMERAANARATAYMRFSLGFCLLWAARYDEAEAELSSALTTARRIGDVTTEIRSLSYLAVAHRKRGLVEAAAGTANETVDAARRSGMLEYVGQATATMAWVAWRRGNLERANELAVTAWETMRSAWQMPAIAWMPLWPLLGVAVREGRLGDAVELGGEMLDATRQPLPDELESELRAAGVAWERSDPDVARAAFERAMEVAAVDGYL